MLAGGGGVCGQLRLPGAGEHDRVLPFYGAGAQVALASCLKDARTTLPTLARRSRVRAHAPTHARSIRVAVEECLEPYTHAPEA